MIPKYMDNNKKKNKEKSNSSEEDVPTTTRRVRTVMSTYQSKVLFDYFAQNPFPSTELREELSRTLKMRPRTIQIWFQNQRQKSKNKREYYPQYSDAYSDEYRQLNVLATVAAGILIEKQKEEKNRKSHR
jgi:hypothetical protein